MVRRRKKAGRETATVSRGSACHALGIENADARMLRSRLMRKVGKVIEASRYLRGSGLPGGNWNWRVNSKVFIF